MTTKQLIALMATIIYSAKILELKDLMAEPNELWCAQTAKKILEAAVEV